MAEVNAVADANALSLIEEELDLKLALEDNADNQIQEEPDKSQIQEKKMKYANQKLASKTLNTKSVGDKKAAGGKKHTINCAGAKAVKAVLDLMIEQNPSWKETTN